MNVFSVKKLDGCIKRKGFEMVLVKRECDVAIYEQWHGEYFIAFEVIRIRQKRYPKIANTDFEWYEAYPADEKWGDDGFTFRNYEQALKKMDELID